METIAERLEYLRQALRDECIGYGELAELESLVEHIDPDDVELLEAAGVPEFPAIDDTAFRAELIQYHARQVFPDRP
jgi:hypothetical protein